MFLEKNFWGLVFLFCWGVVFSQENRFKTTNETSVKLAFSKTNEAYKKEVKKTFKSAGLFDRFRSEQRSYSYASNNENFDITEVYSRLLNSITLVEERSEKFIVNRLSINSKYSDYAPSFFEGELVFASSRNANSFSKIVHELNNQPFLDLYTTVRASDQRSIGRLKGEINSKFHESSATFSKDGKTVYFTRNNYSKRKSKTNQEGTILLKLYKASYDNGKWRNIEELPFNSDEYSIAHPALSKDGKHLYFASDMPGSFGKSDLYVVEINEDGSFKTPRNLGDQINTSGRETFPYISDKGKLFFASDGHDGLGGLDVFMILPDRNGVAGVYNLGEPINSTKDDFTFIINEENKIGYFASNRKGGRGDDDIYGFRQMALFPKYRPDSRPYIKWKLERVIELMLNKEATTSL